MKSTEMHEMIGRTEDDTKGFEMIGEDMILVGMLQKVAEEQERADLATANIEMIREYIEAGEMPHDDISWHEGVRADAENNVTWYKHLACHEMTQGAWIAPEMYQGGLY